MLCLLYPAQLAATSKVANIANVRNAGANPAARLGDPFFPAVAIIPASANAKMYNAAMRAPLSGLFDGHRPPADAAAGAWTVRTALTAPELGFTLCGLKLQFPPDGKPEHASPSTCLNPFFGVTVIVNMPEAPCAIVSDELLMDSE